jgi:hypothetical protein
VLHKLLQTPSTITAQAMLYPLPAEVSMSTMLICAVALFVGVFVFGIVALAAFIITDAE